MVVCTLCKSTQTTAYFNKNPNSFFKCSNCSTIFRDPKSYLSAVDEKNRYLLHNNDVNDKRYQKFVQPIVQWIFSNFNENHSGLDFGAGTGPVITKLLSDKGFKVALYDPYFHNNPELLQHKYDYIICCEVIEHFHHPLKEFLLLKNMLNPNAHLICMTDLISVHQDFEQWYYKDDPTHVLFYSEENLNWIKEKIGFNQLYINERLIVLQ